MQKLKVTPKVPLKFRRAAVKDEVESVNLARTILLDMAQELGVSDLAGFDVLDVGCGVRYTQAILTHGLPIKSYTGVDTYGEMIDFLREKVDDPRFSFQKFEAKNALYATDQEKMSEDDSLPVGNSKFDIICAQSLFTHFDPDDFQTMLKLMRKVIRPDGRLMFSAFLNERSETGHGYVDHWLQKLTPEQREIAEAGFAAGKTSEKFIDAVPEEPLLVALYRRDFAMEMVRNAGWDVLYVRDPKPYIHHHFVCKPS